jgi:6-pyruvoyltetrahydropterin/6-carboxytetrahydropterin synthase
MAFRLLLEKEDFKFSVSHFTIFGADKVERMHGHNYYVVVDIGVQSLDPQLGLAFDFNMVKPIIRKLTSGLDEHVLLPELSPFLKLDVNTDRVRATIAQSHYEFPRGDVIILPVVNVTSEELARHFSNLLISQLKAQPQIYARISSLNIGIQETRGQTVFFQATI